MPHIALVLRRADPAFAKASTFAKATEDKMTGERSGGSTK